MNVKNILCPVDFSNSGDAAMSYAASLAKEYQAELHLVHVYEQPFAYVDGGFASAPVPAVPPADMEAEEAKLEAVKPEKDVKFLRQFIVGSPADELVNYAKEQNIDLVVMGTHGRTGLNRLLMGSIAEGIVRRSPCPVLTIKQPAKELQESS
jgi:nucleotide-binding universal stress UspA family protein